MSAVRQDRLLSVAACSAALACSLLSASAGAQGINIATSYRYASDEARVIELHYRGGMVSVSPSITISGDGLMVARLYEPDGHRRLLRTYELQLSAEELAGMLDRAVAAGLMEFDADLIAQRMQALSRPPTRVTDAPTVEIRLRLEDYSTAAGLSGPRTAVVALVAADLQARDFPEIRELRGVRDLERTVNALLKRAMEVQR